MIVGAIATKSSGHSKGAQRFYDEARKLLEQAKRDAGKT